MSETAELTPGRVVDGRYRIVGELGHGGMGTVYAAEHMGLHRKVALKVLRKELAHDDSSARRFAQEARAASAIEHRNVVDIFDFGTLPSGCFYYVMEMLAGEDLAQVLHRVGRLPWASARGIVEQVIRALGAAHERGVVHRDIKPSNCFVVAAKRPGDPDTIKILDFGIAKVASPTAGGPALTAAHDIIGTALYMAPEQARGEAVDARTDIYAVGVLMYRMLTGRVPFSGSSNVQVIIQHATAEPPRPRSIVPELAQEVEAIIVRALAKDPGQRFGSMEEFERAVMATAGSESRPVTGSGGDVQERPYVVAETRLRDGSWPGGSEQVATPKTEILDSLVEADAPSNSSATMVLPPTAPGAASRSAHPQVATDVGARLDEEQRQPTETAASTEPSPGVVAATARWHRAALLGVLPVTGLGLGVGLMLSRGQPPPEHGVVVQREHPAVVSVPPSPSPSGPQGEGSAGADRQDSSRTIEGELYPNPNPEPGPVRPEPSIAPNAPLEAWGTLPARAWSLAPGSIAGRVVDQDGEPIRNAGVCALVLAEDVPSEYRRRPVCGRSDRKGRYTLKQLAPSYYQVSAGAPRFVSGRHEAVVVVMPGAASPDHDIPLVPGGVEIRGRVRDTRGTTVGNAVVRVSSEGDIVAHTRANRRGVFSAWVNPGSYRVVAWADEHAPAEVQGTVPGDSFAVVVAREWSGEVRWDSSDDPVEGALVEIDDQRTYTDAKGRFRMGGLAGRTYDAVVSADGAHKAQHEVPLRPGTSMRRTKVRLVAVAAKRPPDPPEGVESRPSSPPPDPAVVTRRRLTRAVTKTCGDLAGAIVVKAMVDDHGKISTLRVDGADGERIAPSLAACVENAVRARRYPSGNLDQVTVTIRP